MRKQTPWGHTQHTTVLADGIISYETASHGGIWLSKKRQKQLGYKNNFLNNPEWWEEDCDWAVPYLRFADEIEKYGHAYKHNEMVNIALETVKRYHPEYLNA